MFLTKLFNIQFSAIILKSLFNQMVEYSIKYSNKNISNSIEFFELFNAQNVKLLKFQVHNAKAFGKLKVESLGHYHVLQKNCHHNCKHFVLQIIYD
jgi:hypothetical protein